MMVPRVLRDHADRKLNRLSRGLHAALELKRLYMGELAFRTDKEVSDIRASRCKLQEVGSQFVSSDVATMSAAEQMEVSVDQVIVDAPSGGVARLRTPISPTWQGRSDANARGFQSNSRL